MSDAYVTRNRIRIKLVAALAPPEHAAVTAVQGGASAQHPRATSAALRG